MPSIDLPHGCEQMVYAVGETTMPVSYSQVFREYGINYQDGGTAILLITHCPFCGQGLPLSLRDQWYDRLAELGLEDDGAAIPLDLQTDEWWRRSEPPPNPT